MLISIDFKVTVFLPNSKHGKKSGRDNNAKLLIIVVFAGDKKWLDVRVRDKVIQIDQQAEFENWRKFHN